MAFTVQVVCCVIKLHSHHVTMNVSFIFPVAQGAGGRLVLDIRNNGGGLFPAGVQLGRLLLPSGDIVLIADSDGEGPGWCVTCDV